MRLLLENNDLIYEGKSLEEFTRQWNGLLAELKENGRYVHYVTIDGEVHYDGYEGILIENVAEVGHVSVTSISSHDALNETQVEIVQYCGRLLSHFPMLGDKFYGVPSDEDWSLFTQMIEGLEWLIQSVRFYTVTAESMPEHQAEIGKLNEISEKLVLLLKQLGGAIAQQDFVLVGDLIQYEMMNPVEQIAQLLGERE